MSEEEEYSDNGYDMEEEEDDGIEAPDFLVPETLEQDEQEIAYYAKKLGIDPEVNEWDSYLIDNGYAKILEGITAGRPTKKKQKVEMVKAVRTEEEEAARREFTGFLNRIAPSNFNIISAQIREAFAKHDSKVSKAMFTRCITQRLYSDAILPDMFIDVYSRSLLEVPDAIQPVVDALNSSDKKDTKNVKNFLEALGKDTVSYYSSTDGKNTTIDEDVTKLNKIASQMHMTTDVRRGVFYALMTAVDVSDAVMKISKLQLSKTMRKDVPVVIIECCRNESKYNPYYAAVTEAFAQNDKHFVHDLMKALRNTLQLCVNFETPQIRNAALFASELTAKAIVNFSFLKGTQFARLDTKQQVFIMVYFREYFTSAEPAIIDDEVSKLEGGFRRDVGKFLAKKVLSFCEKSKAFTPEKKTKLNSVISDLTAIE